MAGLEAGYDRHPQLPPIRDLDTAGRLSEREQGGIGFPANAVRPRPDSGRRQGSSCAVAFAFGCEFAHDTTFLDAFISDRTRADAEAVWAK